jgi:hypothetical protein
MPSSSGSLVNHKPKYKLNHHTAAMFYFILMKVYYHTSLQGRNLIVASTAYTAQVRGTSIVLITGNYNS